MSEENKVSVKQTTDPVVLEMESKYPEMTREFKKIMREQYELFCKKQSNYGPDNISLGKDLSKPEDIKLSQMGIFFRMNDKIQRIKQMVVLNAQDNVGEAVDDTYQDLSTYSIIAQIVKKGKWGK
jgi:hypothetical protein